MDDDACIYTRGALSSRYGIAKKEGKHLIAPRLGGGAEATGAARARRSATASRTAPARATRHPASPQKSPFPLLDVPFSHRSL